MAALSTGGVCLIDSSLSRALAGARGRLGRLAIEGVARLPTPGEADLSSRFRLPRNLGGIGLPTGTSRLRTYIWIRTTLFLAGTEDRVEPIRAVARRRPALNEGFVLRLSFCVIHRYLT